MQQEQVLDILTQMRMIRNNDSTRVVFLIQAWNCLWQEIFTWDGSGFYSVCQCAHLIFLYTFLRTSSLTFYLIFSCIQAAELS
jgi:hypothetical protein